MVQDQADVAYSFATRFLNQFDINFGYLTQLPSNFLMAALVHPFYYSETMKLVDSGDIDGGVIDETWERFVEYVHLLAGDHNELDDDERANGQANAVVYRPQVCAAVELLQSRLSELKVSSHSHSLTHSLSFLPSLSLTVAN